MAAVTAMIVSPTYGNFVFDAVFSMEHQSSVTVTKHPVQYGASVTDHAVNEPDEVMLSVGMTDVAASAGGNRSVNAYELLRQIKELREPVTLVTRLHTYRDMVITSLSVPDDYTTMFSLKANLIFSHVLVVPATVVTVQQTVSSSKTTETSKKTSTKSKSKTTTKKTTTKTTASPSTEDASLLYKTVNKKASEKTTGNKLNTSKTKVNVLK